MITKFLTVLLLLSLLSLSGCVTRQVSPPTLTPSASYWYQHDSGK